jgi:PAS domain S-box-containing protein
MDKILEQLLKDAPDAILVADHEGLIRFWNAGAERIFGHGAADAMGQSLDLIIPENLRGRHWEGYRRVMATGETKYKTGLLTSPGVSKDASRVSLEFSIVLLRHENGEMYGFASIMRDVTDRWHRDKGLREKLAACESELGRRSG